MASNGKVSKSDFVYARMNYAFIRKGELARIFGVKPQTMTWHYINYDKGHYDGITPTPNLEEDLRDFAEVYYPDLCPSPVVTYNLRGLRTSEAQTEKAAETVGEPAAFTLPEIEDAKEEETEEVRIMMEPEEPKEPEHIVHKLEETPAYVEAPPQRINLVFDGIGFETLNDFLKLIARRIGPDKTYSVSISIEEEPTPVV